MFAMCADQSGRMGWVGTFCLVIISRPTSVWAQLGCPNARGISRESGPQLAILLMLPL
jgi:hypothetical protein